MPHELAKARLFNNTRACVKHIAPERMANTGMCVTHGLVWKCVRECATTRMHPGRKITRPAKAIPSHPSFQMPSSLQPSPPLSSRFSTRNGFSGIWGTSENLSEALIEAPVKVLLEAFD